MKKIEEFLEQKSHIPIAIFIAIQGVLFTVFTVFFFIENESDVKYKLYICGSMSLLLIFMIHFAYHSIKKAYFIELIAFLIMSTSSSALFIFNFYKYVIAKNEKVYYDVIGIVSIVLLSIGNIVYFVSAYYCYSYFQMKFFEKLGAKVILHRIFFWVQFNNSMLKSDFGLILLFMMTTYLFSTEYIWFILDTLVGVVLFVNIFLMRISLRSEIKIRAILILVVRVLLEGYKLYRVIYMSYNLDFGQVEQIISTQYKGIVWIVLGIGVVDEVILILIVLSTIMCILNFGKGLKEMRYKQNQVALNNSTQLSEIA